MGYKENLATGKSVFEDLRGSRGGAVHLVSLPPPQASGMPVHPTPRGESQPPASASADFVSILEEDQRTIEGSPSKKSHLLHSASPGPPWALRLNPSSRLPEHSAG